MEKTEITVEFRKGYWLTRAINEAIELSENEQCIVKFEFNGTLLTVTPNDGFNDIMKQYNKSREKK